MAQIIVLTAEAKSILQDLVFKEINQMPPAPPADSIRERNLDTLHKIYADIVGTKR